MNDEADRARFVASTLRSALARARAAADASARRAHGGGRGRHADDAGADGAGAGGADTGGASGVRTLIVAEATLLYVQPGSAAGTVRACVRECAREARDAAARGASDARGAPCAQLLFADRLPGTVPLGARDLDTAEARARERAAVELWLGETADLRLDRYLVKPGMARQMGVASALPLAAARALG